MQLAGVFGIQSQSVENYINSGLKEDDAGNYSKAITCFSKAIELEPNIATAWYNRGISHMKLGKYSLAVVDFNRAILLDTALIDAYYNRHLAYQYTQNYQFALADINFYINHKPFDTQAVEARAVLARTMQEWEIAERDYLFILAADPTNIGISLILADIYFEQKKYKEAEEIFSIWILRMADRSELYLHRAYCRNRMGTFDASNLDINLYLMNNVGNPEALKLKADNYFYLKQFDDAVNLYLELLVKDSLNPNLLADYGHCLLQIKAFEKAEKILTKSIQSKNENPAYAYLGRGIARYNLNMLQEACTDWDKSLKLGEKSAGEYLKLHCEQQTGKQ